jgi:hypothetical protein
MRDIKRIRPFLKKLGDIWETVPDWRFGQLMSNVLNSSKIDQFFLEEGDCMKLFDDFFATEFKNKGV